MTRLSGSIGGVSDQALATRGLSFGTPLVRPQGFTYPRQLFPFDFRRDATGRVRTNFDRRAWAPTPDVMPWSAPATYHVDAARADDSGDGLSWATAKRGIAAAIGAGNASAAPGYIVNVRAGQYPRALCPTGSSGTVVPAKPCALIAVGGRVETGFFDALTWSVDTGSTYKATRANTRRVIDLAAVDADGLNVDLAWAGSLADCRATPGSWWTDNATLYVHRADEAAATAANTRALLNVNATGVVQMTSAGNMYLSGFDVQGGVPASLSGNAAGRFVAEDCTFRYAAGDDGIVTAAKGPANGVAIFDVQGAAFLRCDASANQADGFNSHVRAGAQAFVFTMDCTGFGNGRPGATSCNFLTTHDGGRWIDLRGIGARNAGGQVAIVNDGTAMWCIDTFCYDSRGDQIFGGSVPPSDFVVDQSEGGSGSALFLDNCAGGSTPFGLNVRHGTIYVRQGKFRTQRLAANGGTIASLS